MPLALRPRMHHTERVPVARRTVELESARPLSPIVRELVLRVPGIESLSWVPGQWISLELPLPPGGTTARAYSIAAAPDGTARFPIAVTRVEGGAGSAWLHAIEPGARFEAVGPQGFFTLEVPPGEAPARPAVFVGTGTGVCPLRAMIQQAVAAAPDPTHAAPLALLFGVRHEEDLLYRDDWERLARERDGAFRFCPTLSRPEASWTGRSGYVQSHLHDLVGPLARSPEGCDVYVCGLRKMIDAVRAVLKDELGLERRDIHTERYD